jgi:hypothetical protein
VSTKTPYKQLVNVNNRKADKNNNSDEQAIQFLIASRNEMVKALKKVLEQMNKRNDKGSGKN